MACPAVASKAGTATVWPGMAVWLEIESAAEKPQGQTVRNIAASHFRESHLGNPRFNQL